MDNLPSVRNATPSNRSRFGWALGQWNDVKGNVKFFILSSLLVGGGDIVRHVLRLFHGGDLWQQIETICIILWAMCATAYAAIARRHSPQVTASQPGFRLGNPIDDALRKRELEELERRRLRAETESAELQLRQTTEEIRVRADSVKDSSRHTSPVDLSAIPPNVIPKGIRITYVMSLHGGYSENITTMSFHRAFVIDYEYDKALYGKSAPSFFCHAQIEFDSGEASGHINYGCWLESKVRRVRFGAGDTRSLLIAIDDGGAMLMAQEDMRENDIEKMNAIPRPLVDRKYRVIVTLLLKDGSGVVLNTVTYEYQLSSEINATTGHVQNVTLVKP